MALGGLSSSVPSEAGSGSRDTAGVKFGPSSVHPALKLPAFSWLIPACDPELGRFLLATGNAEKNQAFSPVELCYSIYHHHPLLPPGSR